MVSQMLEIWLKCEYDYDKFWNYSFTDIETILKSYSDIQERHNRQRYDMAILIASFVGSVFTGKKIPEFEKVYDIEPKENPEMMKAQLLAWMDAVNAKRKAGNQ